MGAVVDGLSLCYLKGAVSTLHPVPVPSCWTEDIPPHLAPSCPQRQSELHTVKLTKLITAGLGIYFLRRRFSRGKNTRSYN